MSHTDWEEVRFLVCCDALGVVDDRHERWEDLRSRYNEARRFYHNWDHIKDCLLRLDEAEAEGLVRDPYVLEWAIYHHDAIYSTKWPKQNEEMSAHLAQFRIGMHYRDKVQRLILLTEPGMPRGRFRDEELIQDIDLSILGADEGAYDAYTAAIRCEYIWVPEEDFLRGRLLVMEKFAANDRLYNSDYFRSQREDQARHNLNREIQDIKKILR